MKPTTKDFCARELRMAKVKVAGTGVVCLSHLVENQYYQYDEEEDFYDVEGGKPSSI